MAGAPSTPHWFFPPCSLLPCPQRPQRLAWAPIGQLGSRIAYPKDGVPGGKPDIHQGLLPSTPYTIISSTCSVLTSHCVLNMGSPPVPRRAPPPRVGHADLSGCPGPSSPRPLMGAPLWSWPPVLKPAFRSPGSWAQFCRDHMPPCRVWDLGFWGTVPCGQVTEPRSLSQGPSRSPNHHHLPHYHSHRPQDGFLGLHRPSAQLCLLPNMLPSEPGMLRSGSGPKPGPRDGMSKDDREGRHSRVVDNLQPLPFLEG